MILTTVTTAIAFFGSSLCPVLPIKLFGIFCGLLIAVDYILDVVVMFPCLCIYDSYRFQRNYCMDLRPLTAAKEEAEESGEQRRHREVDEEEKMEEEDELALSKPNRDGEQESTSSQPSVDTTSLIRRMLMSYYEFLHRWRYFVLALSMAALGVCSYFATTLKVPPSASDIQLLIDSAEPELNRQWRTELLLTTLFTEQGGGASVIWGVTPADTGNYLDPYEWSQLKLDNSFDPSSAEAQKHLLVFCENIWSQEFADGSADDYSCPMDLFDQWLQEQSSLPLEERNETYTTHCDGATSVPIPQQMLHPCLSNWALQEDYKNVLSWNGVVKVITISFSTNVRFDSHTSLLAAEWHKIENWITENLQEAPKEIAGGYFTSFDFWFWDTNTAVYGTAIESATIAIAVSALVILLSSKSLSMTIFSAISVSFVLVSVASVMAAAGWTLGFL